MIDLDSIERRIERFGSGLYGGIAIELITKLREAEKDAARYRWLRDEASDRHIDIITNHFSEEWDVMVDNAMKEKGDE